MALSTSSDTAHSSDGAAGADRGAAAAAALDEALPLAEAGASAPDGSPRLTEGHVTPLMGLDVFMGGYCVLMFVVSAVGVFLNAVSWQAAAGVLVFLLANTVISQVSFRASRPIRVEKLRAAVGAVIAPLAFVLSDGALQHWWPGFLIMCLGGAIMIPLITQRPLWGRVLVLYYLAILTGTVALSPGQTNWYGFASYAGVIAMVGLTFAQILSILGQTLAREHERSIELKKARDALFAEVEVAQEIQTVLLPKAPTLPGTKVVGFMSPADEVGGDYYDIIHAPGERKFLAVGDVSGHGVTSGLTMMMARASLLGALEANHTASLSELYAALNACICRNLERMELDMYMTFVLLEYHGEGRFQAVGRHLPMFILRHETGEVEELESEGVWLGVLPDIAPEDLEPVDVHMGLGDRLFLYTDGVVEHFAGDDMFGFDRIRDVMKAQREGDGDNTIKQMMEALKAHATFFDDDVTMVVVDYVGDHAAGVDGDGDAGSGSGGDGGAGSASAVRATPKGGSADAA